MKLSRGPHSIEDLMGSINQGAEQLGWELDKLLEETLEAMKAIEG